MQTTVENTRSIETRDEKTITARMKLFGRAVLKGIRLREATPSLRPEENIRGTQQVEAPDIPRKSIDLPEYPGRHELKQGRTTVDQLLKRTAQEEIDRSLAEGAEGKTFSSESGDFHFSSDLSGKIEGAPLTYDELNNRVPMSPSHDDIVFFPAYDPPKKSAPGSNRETTAIPTEQYKIPPQQPHSMN